MRYMDKSLEEINLLLKNGEIKPIDLVNEVFDSIERNKELNAYITLDKEGAIKRAKELENMEVDNLFFGIPIAIKDNIVTNDIRTTAGSKVLENFMSVYDASVVSKIKEKNMIIIGKTNMDEFAMGSSSRTSYFGAPKNPVNKEKISGGSSGGSASTVGANDLFFALGTDTGGSIRQPASYTGIVGMKPTYGRVSRYGLIAFASSLDQIGPMTNNVLNNALLLNVISFKDDKDLTSFSTDEDFTRLIGDDLSGKKIAIPNYFINSVDEVIKNKILEIVNLLKSNNIIVDFIDLKYIDKAVTLYQIIAMSEASSNLARFDGIRYSKIEDNNDINNLYFNTRSNFGDEVKRRIMVGSYLLSGKNAQDYYYKALSIRDDLTLELREVFKDYDYIIGPTTTTTAYNLNDSMDDPLKSFIDDVLVIPVNMAGVPAISIPVGVDSNNMPIGLQIIGDRYEEAKIYCLADYIEKKIKERGR